MDPFLRGSSYPAALIVCTTGMYLITGSSMGVLFMVGAAFAGYTMIAFGYPFIAFIVAFILTPQLESSLVQAVRITNGEWTMLLQHPIALALLALAGVLVFYLLPRKRKTEEALDLD